MVLTKSVQNKYLIGGEGINNYSLKGIVQLKMTYPQVNPNAWLQTNWNIPVESYGQFVMVLLCFCPFGEFDCTNLFP